MENENEKSNGSEAVDYTGNPCVVIAFVSRDGKAVPPEIIKMAADKFGQLIGAMGLERGGMILSSGKNVEAEAPRFLDRLLRSDEQGEEEKELRDANKEGEEKVKNSSISVDDVIKGLKL